MISILFLQVANSALDNILKPAFKMNDTVVIFLYFCDTSRSQNVIHINGKDPNGFYTLWYNL